MTNERIPGINELHAIVGEPIDRTATIQTAQCNYLSGLAVAQQTGNVEQIAYFETALCDLYEARPDLRPEVSQD